MVLQVEYQQSFMVSSQPDMSLRIHLQVPYLQVVRHILYLVFAEQRRIADTPLAVLVYAHIGIVFCRHPDVTVVVHTQVVLLVLRRAVVTHPLVVIHLLTLLTVETNQFAVRRNHHHTVVTGGIGREIIRGIQLVITVAEVKVGDLLSIGVIIVKSLIVELHPEILLRVDIQLLDTFIETEIFLEFLRGVTFKLFRHGVIHTIVHTLMEPELTVEALHNLRRVIVAHSSSIARVGVERLHTIAIIAVQSVHRADPYVTLRVAERTVHLRVRESVTRIQPAELHVGNGSLNGHRNHQQECQHYQRLLQQRLR